MARLHPKLTGSDAVFSPDERYRYRLRRIWGPEPPLVVIGLNPSTATAEIDDPTVQRCQGFARRWGHGGLVMLNLFAWRSTNPKVLTGLADPVGPDNDQWLLQETTGRTTLCAWGNHGALRGRARAVCRLLAGRDLRCLGITNAQAPRHPLYIRQTQPALALPSYLTAQA